MVLNSTFMGLPGRSHSRGPLTEKSEDENQFFCEKSHQFSSDFDRG